MSGDAALWPGGRPPVNPACGKSLPERSFAAMAKGDAEREKRLADALRENLRRRKAQARGAEVLPGTGRGTGAEGDGGGAGPES